jgi:heme A synthase
MSKPHRIDGTALTFGVIYLGIVAWWWLQRSFSIDLPSAPWIVALVLVTAGVLGIVNAVRRGDRTGIGRNRPRSDD